MQLNKTLAVVMSACALSTVATLAASGAPAAAAYKSTLTPKNIHVGQTFHITSSHARPSTSYTCVEIVTKGTAYGYDIASFRSVKSSSAGHVSCSEKYLAFKATVAGKVRYCPQTKADLKAHVKCGVAVSTTDMTSETSANFTSVKH
ncbi:MAG TPA: hypothetical protein VHV76_11520 [Mycobacteriales bacterium]|jgi:hypothetical protein|nr:hypothetical protein [Mycobacteriales bacterium]